MTQEEKARAYDEALKRAKYILHTVETAGCAMHKDLLTEIFPELAESEDERVIKALETFINQPEIADKITFEARIGWLAWLEKQKESLHIPESCKENADSFTSEGERIRKELIDAFSAYDIESSWNGIPVSSVIDWLKNRFKFLGLQSKTTEWSKENEDTYNRVYCLFRDAIDEWYTDIFSGCYPRITRDKVLAMLKSLRPHWKPSEEQMEVDLEKASRNVYESWIGGTMNDVRRDMVELGRVLNARKEDEK